MKRSSEFNKGTLYLISTPIGNLKDISERALATIKEVDYLFCEDTRVTRKLLTHFGIEKQIESFHDYSLESKEDYIINLLESGAKVGLVSDSGTPVISDPGYELVVKARQSDIKISPIPGASAQISALISSGLEVKPYLFYGFLDHKGNQKDKELMELKDYPFTIVFYESPLRIASTLERMYKIFGNRKAVIYREITKMFEESIELDLSEYNELPSDLKGEMVLVVQGSKNNDDKNEELDINKEIDSLIKEGLSLKEASKVLAKRTLIASSDIYNNYLRYKK